MTSPRSTNTTRTMEEALQIIRAARDAKEPIQHRVPSLMYSVYQTISNEDELFEFRIGFIRALAISADIHEDDVVTISDRVWKRMGDEDEDEEDEMARIAAFRERFGDQKTLAHLCSNLNQDIDDEEDDDLLAILEHFEKYIKSERTRLEADKAIFDECLIAFVKEQLTMAAILNVDPETHDSPYLKEAIAGLPKLDDAEISHEQTRALYHQALQLSEEPTVAPPPRLKTPPSSPHVSSTGGAPSSSRPSSPSFFGTLRKGLAAAIDRPKELSSPPKSAPIKLRTARDTLSLSDSEDSDDTLSQPDTARINEADELAKVIAERTGGKDDILCKQLIKTMNDYANAGHVSLGRFEAFTQANHIHLNNSIHLSFIKNALIDVFPTYSIVSTKIATRTSLESDIKPFLLAINADDFPSRIDHLCAALFDSSNKTLEWQVLDIEKGLNYDFTPFHDGAKQDEPYPNDPAFFTTQLRDNLNAMLPLLASIYSNLDDKTGETAERLNLAMRKISETLAADEELREKNRSKYIILKAINDRQRELDSAADRNSQFIITNAFFAKELLNSDPATIDLANLKDPEIKSLLKAHQKETSKEQKKLLKQASKKSSRDDIPTAKPSPTTALASLGILSVAADVKKHAAAATVTGELESDIKGIRMLYRAMLETITTEEQFIKDLQFLARHAETFVQADRDKSARLRGILEPYIQLGQLENPLLKLDKTSLTPHEFTAAYYQLITESDYASLLTKAINNFHELTDIIQDNKDYAPFQEAAARLINLRGYSKNLSSTAILPIQRAPRHTELLKSLSKKWEEARSEEIKAAKKRAKKESREDASLSKTARDQLYQTKLAAFHAEVEKKYPQRDLRKLKRSCFDITIVAQQANEAQKVPVTMEDTITAMKKHVGGLKVAGRGKRKKELVSQLTEIANNQVFNPKEKYIALYEIIRNPENHNLLFGHKSEDVTEESALGKLANSLLKQSRDIYIQFLKTYFHNFDLKVCVVEEASKVHDICVADLFSEDFVAALREYDSTDVLPGDKAYFAPVPNLFASRLAECRKTQDEDEEDDLALSFADLFEDNTPATHSEDDEAALNELRDEPPTIYEVIEENLNKAANAEDQFTALEDNDEARVEALDLASHFEFFQKYPEYFQGTNGESKQDLEDLKEQLIDKDAANDIDDIIEEAHDVISNEYDIAIAAILQRSLKDDARMEALEAEEAAHEDDEEYSDDLEHSDRSSIPPLSPRSGSLFKDTGSTSDSSDDEDKDHTPRPSSKNSSHRED